MKKINKWLAIGFLVCFLWLTMQGRVSAETAAPPNQTGYNFMFDTLVHFPEERVEQAKQKRYEVKYTKYKPSRYYLEIQFPDHDSWDLNSNFYDSGYALIHSFIVNSVWQLLLIWDFLVISGVESGFSLDIVDIFADKVDAIIQKFVGFNGSEIGNTGIWGNFITFVILLAGAWIAYKGLYKRDTSSAWTGIISTIFILMASLAFFNNSSGVMHYLNDISSGISQEIMGVGLQADMVSTNQVEEDSEKNEKLSIKGINTKVDASQYSSQVSSFVVADKMYDMLIYEPYLMLQYGMTSGDPKLTPERIGRILNNKPGSEARIQAVNEERVGNTSLGYEPNVMVTSLGVFQRLTLLGLLVVSHLILGAVFLFVAGAILVYQFIFVIFALFAPFALLMALYPAWSGLAMDWTKKFIGYQILKIVVGVLLSMILTLSQILYNLTPPEDYGYAWTIIMQLILTVGIIWKRNELIGIVNGSLGKFTQYTDNSKDISKQFSKYLQNATTRIEKIRFPR
ncbi:CD3337/EF1877 family mobilome membrane protein [Shimazuella alba]|uniref:TrbL/VirB6 plasmid conjugal transfer protein n=1 Tax=Shimazuella alba TaxID=2690964 RepID=A0A6I4W5D2_9BACL|nr:type IV secretion system protein [Shimazuella alba]MXQ55522.1 hypothetical protein [Shimazuella alba]